LKNRILKSNIKKNFGINGFNIVKVEFDLLEKKLVYPSPKSKLIVPV